MESFRHMPLENIQNCRDLGGYPIKGGGFTKYGRLLRCGSFHSGRLNSSTTVSTTCKMPMMR